MRISPCGRVHMVLVPGFAGFDALGQLEYYAGVTTVLKDWRERTGAPIVLHYFDNLPTASVATRAERLRGWLAKRVARGEIQAGDAIALVGHSTGGLDIRRLLWDLHKAPEPTRVDGSGDDAVAAGPERLLELVQRVVFLSVPQRGTNIADFVRRLPRRFAIGELRLLVRAANASVPNDVEEGAARGLAWALHSDFMLAVADAVGEMDAAAVKTNACRVAEAHDAASELQLFLRHIACDFGAIDDLAAQPGPAGVSPAHFSDADREEERSLWQAHGIETRSYATVGRRPFRFEPGEAVPAWDPFRPSTGPWARLVPGVWARTDVPYLFAYRACAGGPLAVDGPLLATAFGSSELRSVELWDNDGIVNTASMLWPDHEATRLVDADHGDVIGHYDLRAALASEQPLRRFHTYDLLRSDSGFSDATFRAVWNDVFEFCAGDVAPAAGGDRSADVGAAEADAGVELA